MMKRLLLVVLFAFAGIATAQNEDAIVVMTQNQYLGADLTEIVTATDPVAFNQAVIEALQTIAGNDAGSRIEI